MSEQTFELPYPVVFRAPTEAFPWVTRKTFLQSGFNLVVINDGTKSIKVGLPKNVWQMSMEEIGARLYGTFFGEDGQKISAFSIGREGFVTYTEE